MALAGIPTVLIVECESLVRDAVSAILEEGGFHTLVASSGSEAILLQSSFEGEIHLLLSNVMMPDLSGTDLAMKIKLKRPSIRVMLMSAYPDGALLVLNYGWYFIHKPFLPDVLLSKIRELLHGESREQGFDHFDTRV